MAIVFRSIAKVCLAAALILILVPTFARAQLYTLSSITGWWDYDGAAIRQVDPVTGATIWSRWIAPPGWYGSYITGLAAHPMTGELYSLVPIPPFQVNPITGAPTGNFNGCQHQLVKIDPATGFATIIGNTGICFTSLAFHTNGILYGVGTDWKDLLGPSLFTINSSNGSVTFLFPFGAWPLSSGAVVGGPALAFNPNDGRLYRSATVSGGGQVLQSIDPSTLLVTNIPLSGSPLYEIASLTHLSGNTFLGADAGNQLFSVTSSGVCTLIGSLDHLARGLAFAKMPGSVPLAALVDFDGDGKSDIGIYRNGAWFILRSSDAGVTAIGFGGGTDIPVPADYDGDGIVDIAVYRNGSWIYKPSVGGANIATPFGGGTDIPVPADYDGDGIVDIAVYRNGSWTYKPSVGGAIIATPFGGGTDVPVPADYDGDGKADIAVYRNGLWIVLRSSDSGVTATQFGGGSDVPLPADYDGDGETDTAVYRYGLWIVLRTSDSAVTVTQFGGGSDVPVPADYDGDGKTDLAVYRNGAWFILRSSDGGTTAVGWGGASEDIPLN